LWELSLATALIAPFAGGAQGIGRAFAHALGEAGAAVAVVDINASKAKEVRDELHRKGIRSVAITADITKASSCDA
jgi:NAD(P)-dependent dehydrogenase (short-subunit alcohol dehydrogenase family)